MVKVSVILPVYGVALNMEQVRPSIARRLGIPAAGLVDSPRYIDGVVEMMLDATQRYDEPLTDERLFGWHNTLFPTGRSGLYKIDVGCYRTHGMQVVSSPMGMERVHYEAPEPSRVPREMRTILSWINTADTTDPLLRDSCGNLTTGKWAKICHCSTDTALNDIKDLFAKDILEKGESGGRSTHYVMRMQQMNKF